MGPVPDFYYNGKTMMAFAPAEDNGRYRSRTAYYRRHIESGVRARRDLLSVQRRCRERYMTIAVNSMECAAARRLHAAFKMSIALGSSAGLAAAADFLCDVLAALGDPGVCCVC
jgi:hypothetical protein